MPRSEHSMSTNMKRVLVELKRREGEVITPSSLARAVGANPNAIMRTVEKLRERGYLNGWKPAVSTLPYEADLAILRGDI